jgi:hypothetical protein
LWREDLARGLIWTNHKDEYDDDCDLSLEDVVLPYRAATWSWARSDCGMAIPRMYGDDEAEKVFSCLEVLSADIELAGDDPFGQVKSGCLEIRGKTCKGIVRRLD